MVENKAARRVDALGVVLSLILLTVASVGLTGDPWWFVQSAVKWVVAGTIALIGLGLLLGSLPRRRPDRVGAPRSDGQV